MGLLRHIYAQMWAIKKWCGWSLHSAYRSLVNILRHYPYLLIFTLFVTISLSACVKLHDPEGTQDYHSDIVGVAENSQTVGQTFVSRRPRINGLAIWVSASQENTTHHENGQLIVKLFTAINASDPIHTISVPISSDWIDTLIDIPIPAQDNPAQQSYYLVIESTGGIIQIHGRNEDSYSNGNAWQNGIALPSDIAFRTYYDYDHQALVDDVKLWGRQSGLLLLLWLVIYLPGWFLLDITGIGQRFMSGERIALSVGLSLAFFAILMLWSSIIHISINRQIIIYGFCLLVGYFLLRMIWQIVVFLRNKCRDQDSEFPSLQLHKLTTMIGLVLVVIGALFIRLAMVRDLAAPAWVDSVHHATITRLIIQNGGIPSSYEPYMQFNIYNYHVGFHSGLAIFTWLANLELPDAMLLYAQALNALAALGVFLLTTTYTRNNTAGLFAAIITSFLTPMPAYYTSWGRYTQLAGLLILPAALALVRQVIYSHDFIFTRNKTTIFTILLAVISLSGLFLVHYRVLAFLIFLLSADLIAGLPFKHRLITNYLIQWGRVLGVLCLLAVIFTLPWLYPTIKEIYIPKLSPASSTGIALFRDFSWRFLTAASGKQTLVLAGMGLFLSMIRRPRYALLIIIWIVQLLFVSNLDALGLPGGGFITGTSVVITLFIPISMSGGYLLSELSTSWQSITTKSKAIKRIIFPGIVILVIAYITIFGSRQIIPIINPITILARQSDFDAMEWIRENVSPEASFLINPFSWGFGLYGGNDGGYWLSSVTGVSTIPPPALYGLGNQDEINNINKICSITVNPNSTPEQVLGIMADNQIDYIYLGKRAGPLSPSTLLDSGLFKRIYSEDGVQIFEPIYEP
mgnify:CR=1 FL=1